MYYHRITCDTCIIVCINANYHCITSHVEADVETAEKGVLNTCITVVL